MSYGDRDKYGLTQVENLNIRIACCKAGAGDGWGEHRSLRNHLGACHARIDELDSFARWYESDDDAHLKDQGCFELYWEWRGLKAACRRAGLFLGEPYDVVADAYGKEYDRTGGRVGFGEFLHRLLS